MSAIVFDPQAKPCPGDKYEARTCLATGPAISEETNKMLPAAFAGAAQAGLAVAGPPVSAYFTWDDSPGGKTRFTCGPSVARGGSAELLLKDAGGDDDDAGLGVRKAGGCKCVTTVHKGPYDELKECYGATFEWIKAKGYAPRMPVFELYENDPKDTAPDKLRTKVCIPIDLPEEKETTPVNMA